MGGLFAIFLMKFNFLKIAITYTRTQNLCGKSFLLLRGKKKKKNFLSSTNDSCLALSRCLTKKELQHTFIGVACNVPAAIR